MSKYFWKRMYLFNVPPNNEPSAFMWIRSRGAATASPQTRAEVWVGVALSVRCQIYHVDSLGTVWVTSSSFYTNFPTLPHGLARFIEWAKSCVGLNCFACPIRYYTFRISREWKHLLFLFYRFNDLHKNWNLHKHPRQSSNNLLANSTVNTRLK